MANELRLTLGSLAIGAVLVTGFSIFLKETNIRAIRRLDLEAPKAEALFRQGFPRQGIELAEKTLRQAENYKTADLRLGIEKARLDAIISDCKTLLSNHYAGAYSPQSYNLGTNSGNTVSRTNHLSAH
jgi:hypothetical protein